MVTISHLVEKIIEKKPFIQEALSKGIINNAALAEELKPIIEKELKKKIKFSAVNMAIRRLSEKLKNNFTENTKFDNKSDITIKSNLVEIVVYKEQETQEKIKKVHDLIDFKKGDFFSVTQGNYEVMIIINEKHEQKVKTFFDKKNIKKVISGLSSLTVNLPEEAVETIGYFYVVTRALNWENINIVDIVSTFTEMTFIVKEEDAAASFNTLRKLIKNKSYYSISDWKMTPP
ncbi:MAG: hypothetical protein KKA51_01080 [Nanoarchaeota archaeon]|nr:hypothetical protein [Nanoarchaeota archaeon]